MTYEDVLDLEIGDVFIVLDEQVYDKNLCVCIDNGFKAEVVDKSLTEEYAHISVKQLNACKVCQKCDPSEQVGYIWHFSFARGEKQDPARYDGIREFEIVSRRSESASISFDDLLR